MNDDGAGCLGVVFLLALLWIPFHFSGYSVLFWRDSSMFGSFFAVECRYLNSTGVEKTYHTFTFAIARDQFYCPRSKRVGQD